MIVNDDEAAVIRDLAARVIGGESLTNIAKDLTERQVPTVQGGATWSTRSVHAVVSKARIAALREHKGEVVGPAVWPRSSTARRGSECAARWPSVRTARRTRSNDGLPACWVCSRCGHQLHGWHMGGASRTPTKRYWCRRGLRIAADRGPRQEPRQVLTCASCSGYATPARILAAAHQYRFVGVRLAPPMCHRGVGDRTASRPARRKPSF